jgi:hypothetical protein
VSVQALLQLRKRGVGMQVPPQQSVPAGQRLPQLPQWLAFQLELTQRLPQQLRAPAGQTAPQPPQFCGSFVTSRQLEPHVRNCGQGLQVPAQQVSPPAQRLPQPPQWLALLLKSTHWLLQQGFPGAQTLSQPPQWFGATVVSVHVPPHLRNRGHGLH